MNSRFFRHAAGPEHPLEDAHVCLATQTDPISHATHTATHIHSMAAAGDSHEVEMWVSPQYMSTGART
jgi:hypothetical protein